jgi:hypothetical protein
MFSANGLRSTEIWVSFCHNLVRAKKQVPLGEKPTKGPSNFSDQGLEPSLKTGN